MEIINCYDCKQPVSFSATACPHCGSIEHTGPYQFSKKEARCYRIEQKNDHNLLVTSLVLGLICGLYGFVTSTTSFGAIVSTTAYGGLGILVGVPLAFTVNMVRHASYFAVPVGGLLLLLAYHFFK